MAPVRRRKKNCENLLPDDAYRPDPATGASMPAGKRANIDRRLRELQHTVPTEPGRYVDGGGDPWVLDAEGGWTDHRGERRGPEWAPMIAVFVYASGPFVRADSTGNE